MFTAQYSLLAVALNKTDDVSSIKINNDILFSRLILKHKLTKIGPSGCAA